MDLGSFREAADRIAPYIKRTPLEYSHSLSKRMGTSISVKYELFQRTGSFKVRGAFNKLLQMPDSERSRGVVAVSGGNHAQAVAFAAAKLGVDAVIVMPENTPAASVAATRDYGARVDLEPNIAECFEKVREYEDQGRVFVHPFDDEEIITGQGTLGLEIVDTLPDVTDVIVSIGGGGMAAGVAVACRQARPGVRVWGVETEGADAMSQAIAAGAPVELPAITSIAKTLGAPYVSERTLSLIRENLESVTVVTDQDAVRSMELIAERLKVVAEPAAACTLAAAERLRVQFTEQSRVVLVLCGGNTSLKDACTYLAMF